MAEVANLTEARARRAYRDLVVQTHEQLDAALRKLVALLGDEKAAACLEGVAQFIRYRGPDDQPPRPAA